ncbi:DUF6932 family protein [Streptomyces sp. NPDC091280]|uniref:DUF6932 family protein n=1 Tax=Streptomyces sp. NPDC091280 TaxID=3365984 RepID=UPI00380D8A2C
MPLPSFNDHGYLPPGEHEATWEEVEKVLGWNFKRKDLLVGLHYVVKSLVEFGVTEFYLDGSFVTNKVRPGDVEVIYMPPKGVDTRQWGLFSFAQHDTLKKRYKIDLWPYPSPQPTSSGYVTIKEFFSSDLDDVPKGIVRLSLEGFE